MHICLTKCDCNAAAAAARCGVSSRIATSSLTGDASLNGLGGLPIGDGVREDPTHRFRGADWNR